MKITKLKLHTNNLQQTIAYYSDILLLPIVELKRFSVTFQAGTTQLTFIEVDKPLEVYHFAFNIDPKYIKSALVWAKDNVKVITNTTGELITHFDNWKAKSIYFTDNNGNLLEFIARQELKSILSTSENSDEFAPDKILNVSEIGLVYDQPIERAEELIANYELNYFVRSTPTADFLALGDDMGLLIMVTPHRNWFPTTIQAKPGYCKIELNNNDQLITIESCTAPAS